jgi:predicted nucleic acid-binding protein
MAEKTVLSDASPLIGLAAAGAFELLRGLFGEVAVTATVRKEVAAGKGMPGEKELAAAIRAGWVRATRDPRIDARLADLDPGEASTISAALVTSGRCLVLMDDPEGRERAESLGVEVTGTAGILLAAKKRRLVTAVRPLLETLARNSDFRLSAEIAHAILTEAGEAAGEYR